MPGPIALARSGAERVLIQCARALGSGALPAEKAIRFRPDGKGGELASPFPMASGLDSAALAAAAPEAELFERVYPSGGWIAFDLSQRWRELVRETAPAPLGLDCNVPTVPAFPARIEPGLWRLDALAGITDPETAARLDRGNPAFQARRAETLARQNRGGNRPDRRLVNEAAALMEALDAKDAARTAAALLRLARLYLETPGEDALVGKVLRCSAKSLGI